MKDSLKNKLLYNYKFRKKLLLFSFSLQKSYFNKFEFKIGGIMKFYIKLLLLIIFSVVTFIIFPTSGHILWKSKINENINQFNSISELIKELFKTNEKDIYPKYNTKFDTEKLKELGKKLHINFDKVIKNVNEPYGSYWIDTALQISITNLAKDMESKIYEINRSMKFYNFISALIGLIILLIFFVIQKFQPSNKKFVSYLFAFIITIGILIFLYFNLKTLVFINITKPLQILFSKKNITSIFHFGTIVISLQIAFLIFLILKALNLKSDKFVFFWFIPAIIMPPEIWTDI